MKGITKYYIGLGVIGVFTVVILMVVLMQGISARHDNHLYQQANKVADKLNSYVDKNSKVPESLAAAGITDVPSDVTYVKKATDKYEFCVTYRAASDGFDVSNPTQALSERAAEQYYGGGSTDNYGSSSDASSYFDATLYLSASHKAGKNCQTIKPYINTYDSFGNSGSSGTSCKYDATNSDANAALNDYYNCLDDTQNSGNLPNSSSPTFTN